MGTRELRFVERRRFEQRERQYKHARKRMYQRYGLEMSREEWEELGARIANGEGSRIAKNPSATRWRIGYHGVDVVAVVGKSGRVLTILLHEEPWWTLLKQLRYG